MSLLLVGFWLVILTAAVYAPVRHNGFVCWDDEDYLVNNPHVQEGLTAGSLRWAFTSFYAANWHPLTWMSHLVDCQIWGLNAEASHLENVAWHCANGLLLLLVLHALTGALWRSAFVASLFALHPLHVESVVWAAERKDVLSTFFLFSTIGAYVWCVRQPSWRRKLAVVGCLSLGLLAKPMLVTLPFVLLLLDYWPLGRMRPEASWAERRSLVWEKVPLLILVVVSCVVTYFAQLSGGSVQSFTKLPSSLRLENAALSYEGYLEKALWPVDLTAVYPYRTQLELGQVLLATSILGIITALAFGARRRAPYLLVGWLWYLGTLVPVIGFVQVGLQAMADRYSYVPIVGIFIAIAWGAPELWARWPGGKAFNAGVAAILLTACVVQTRRQILYWHDTVSLFEHSLKVAPSAAAYGNLAAYLITQGRVALAIDHCEKAIDLDPKYLLAHTTLSVAFALEGRAEEAAAEGELALRLNPTYILAHTNLAKVFLRQGKIEEAISHFKRALQIDPDSVDTLRNLAWIRATCSDAQWRDGGEALRLAQRAMKLTSESRPEMLDALAAAQAENGRFTEASGTARRALAGARAAHQTSLAIAVGDRLQLYQLEFPYRSKKF